MQSTLLLFYVRLKTSVLQEEKSIHMSETRSRDLVRWAVMALGFLKSIRVCDLVEGRTGSPASRMLRISNGYLRAVRST